MTPEARPPEPPEPAGRPLHPAVIGVVALGMLRSLAVPLALIIVVGSRELRDTLLFGLIGLALAVAGAIQTWMTTRWFLDEDEIRLRRRFLGEGTTSVPYDRVQAVDTVRGPVQRLFGVVELHVQTAGGGAKGEIVLRAVTSADADDVREAVRRGRGTATAAPHAPHAGPPFSPHVGPPFSEGGRGLSPEDPESARAVSGGGRGSPAELGHPFSEGGRGLPAEVGHPSSEGGRGLEAPREWALGTRDLLLAAATSGSLAVLLPVVAFGSQIADDLLGFEDAERLVPDSVGEAAVVVAAVLAAAWVLSFVGTIVAFAGFSVVRDGERLRIRRGILERREASVAVARVHALRVVESPLRQPFGLAQVRVETAGYASEAASAQTLVPLVRTSDLAAVLHHLVPELDVPFDVEPLPRRAARRYIVPPVLVAVATTVGAVVAFGPVGVAGAILVVIAAAGGLASYRSAGVGMHGERVVLRSRTPTLARTTAAADASRLQAVRSSASPLQRRGHLATLAVDVSSGRRLRVAHLDADAADAARDRLARAATVPPDQPRAASAATRSP